jgi:hypothetical protein
MSLDRAQRKIWEAIEDIENKGVSSNLLHDARKSLERARNLITKYQKRMERNDD